MGAALVAASGFLMCSGPVLLGALVLLLMGVAIGMERGVLQVCIAIGSLQLVASLAVGVLYRWCFGKAPVRGAGLLAVSIISVALMSDERFLGLLGQVFEAPLDGIQLAQFLGAMIISGLTLVGLTCVVCTATILLIELPLRWVQGEWQVVSDGAFRAVRAFLILLLVAVSSEVIRDRGVSSLVDMVARALG
jgi:hypothetical protein